MINALNYILTLVNDDEHWCAVVARRRRRERPWMRMRLTRLGRRQRQRKRQRKGNGNGNGKRKRRRRRRRSGARHGRSRIRSRVLRVCRRHRSDDGRRRRRLRWLLGVAVILAGFFLVGVFGLLVLVGGLPVVVPTGSGLHGAEDTECVMSQAGQSYCSIPTNHHIVCRLRETPPTKLWMWTVEILGGVFGR